jgi:acyl carrier protein
MSTLEILEKFLISEVAADSGKESLTPNEDLLMQGIIDSLGIIKLVSFLESQFGIKVGDDEIVPENFQSINAIKEYVEKKQSK